MQGEEVRPDGHDGHQNREDDKLVQDGTAGSAVGVVPLTSRPHERHAGNL